MTGTALHPAPRAMDVLREQLRVLALSLRVPFVAAALLALGLALLAVLRVTGPDAPLDFRPELAMAPAIAGLMLPVAVWRGEDRFGGGFMWTLPVERRRHALTRVCVGWIWLMAAMALFTLWLLGMTLLTGGRVLGDEAVRLLTYDAFTPLTHVDPAALRSARWTPPVLLWLVPFTAATGTYLLSNALALGVRHPLRWMGGVVLGFFLVLGTVELSRAARTRMALTRAFNTAFYGPYGVDALLTARGESLHTVATLTTGETVEVWRGLPDTGEWALATLLWTSAGAAALWAAAARHRERRPA